MNNRIVITLLALLIAACQHKPDQPQADYLITGGQVYTGIDAEPQQLNIGICGDRICYLGDAILNNARHTIDASGLTLTPGFIDPHTHSLEELLSNEGNHNLNYLTQGVTTVITGNDGDGDPHVAQLAKQLNDNGTGTNVALLAGHNAIRTAVMGKTNRAPTTTELNAMVELLDTALSEGAVGFSTGLYYVPGVYATTEEVITLAHVAARHQAPYDSHIRDESTFNIGYIPAIKEFIEIVRATGVEGHIAHIKALGVDVWHQSGQVIELIEEAHESGLRITADQYPWPASGTFLHSAVVPKEIMAGGRDTYLTRLNENKNNLNLLAQIAENIRKRGGPERLLVTATQQPEWLGKNLHQIAKEHQLTPAQMVTHMVLKEEIRVASFNMHQDDIKNFMQQEWVVTSSDGTNGHPRKYASFPEKYQEYVIKEAVISWPFFVKNSSFKTAQIFKLEDRGAIKLGAYADLNAFKLNDFQAKASFQQWNKLSIGVWYQWINGQLSIDSGQYTGLLNGRVLLKQANSD